MNKTPSEAVALVEELKPLVANDAVDVVFCVPAIDIVPVVEAVKGTNIQVGAENMYFEESGAYTGEISPAMLVDAGVKYVVLGHSERRDYFGETNEDVNKKVLKALEHGITPIMCCGESLEQREQSEEYKKEVPYADVLVGILDQGQFIGNFNTDRLKETINNTFVSYCSGEYGSLDEAMEDMNTKLNGILE